MKYQIVSIIGTTIIFMIGSIIFILAPAHSEQLSNKNLAPEIEINTPEKGIPSAEIKWDYQKTDKANPGRSFTIEKKSPVPFTTLSVGWQNSAPDGNPEDYTIEVASRTADGTYENRQDLSEGVGKHENPSGWNWSELYMVNSQEPHQHFKLKFEAPSEEKIESLKIAVSDTRLQENENTSEERQTSTSVASSQKGETAPAEGGENTPHIIRREDWWGNLNEDQKESHLPYIDITHAVVHHTETPNEPEDPEQTVRSIWDYHVNILGWQDIGYNFLIDHEGNIYQGRHNDHLNLIDVQGAHAIQANTSSVGIALIGQFEPDHDRVEPGEPNEEAIASLEELIAWRFRQNSLEPSDSEDIGNEDNVSRICGHNDVGDTACPGKNLYEKLSSIEDNVENIIEEGSEFKQLNLQISPSESGSVVPPIDQNNYEPGTQLKLTASPAKGHHFANWTNNNDGEKIGDNYTLDFELQEETDIMANFEENSPLGDVKGNGKVEVEDAMLVLRHTVGLIDLKEDYCKDTFYRARIASEGEPGVLDAIQILRQTIN